MTTLRVHGDIRPPGDKSISHRALILSAVARGTSRVRRILDSADVQSTASALRSLGANIPALSPDFQLTGIDPRALQNPDAPIDCGNSGTTARLLAGFIAGAGISATLTGDASLQRRPMRRVADPLRAMGARVTLPPSGGLPMQIEAGASRLALQPVAWTSTVASAQVKSAVLLAALLGGVSARLTEPHLSRDHTERMLVSRGIALARQSGGTLLELPAGQVIEAQDVDVPSDPSSAAFFVALATLAQAGELKIRDVCLNPTRTGFLEVMRRMGADISIVDAREAGGETVGDVVVRPERLRGVQVEGAEVPALIDELPLLACVASQAAGETVVRGASELRVKESDRIAAIVMNLRAIGAQAEELEDGFRIVGKGPVSTLGGPVATHGDHRIAMSFGVLAVLHEGIRVDDPGCVSVSYPGFWNDVEAVTS